MTPLSSYKSDLQDKEKFEKDKSQSDLQDNEKRGEDKSQSDLQVDENLEEDKTENDLEDKEKHEKDESRSDLQDKEKHKKDKSQSDQRDEEKNEKDKKPSRISYTPSPTELRLYESLWHAADSTKNGSIVTLDETLEVLSLSGLPQPKLKIILNMISHGKIFVLNKQQFFVAVRLVQFHQNRQAVQNMTLTVPDGVDLNPPYFKSFENINTDSEQDKEIKQKSFSKEAVPSSRSMETNDSFKNSNDSSRNISSSNGNTYTNTDASTSVSNSLHKNEQNDTCTCGAASYRQVMLENEVDRMRQMLESTMDQVNYLTKELAMVKLTCGVDVKNTNTEYHSHSNQHYGNNHFNDQSDRENKDKRGLLQKVFSQSSMTSKERPETHMGRNNGGIIQSGSFRRSLFNSMRNISGHPLQKTEKESFFEEKNNYDESSADISIADVSDISENEYKEEEKKEEKSLAFTLMRTLSFIRRKKTALASNVNLNVNSNRTFEERQSGAFFQQKEMSLRAMNSMQHSYRSHGSQKFARY